MPEFNDSKCVNVSFEDVSYGSIDVDYDIEITASDFLDECSDEDIIELIEELEDRGYLYDKITTNSKFNHFDDEEWNKTMHVLFNPYSRIRLSDEDIEIIKQIANKL